MLWILRLMIVQGVFLSSFSVFKNIKCQIHYISVEITLQMSMIKSDHLIPHGIYMTTLACRNLTCVIYWRHLVAGLFGFLYQNSPLQNFNNINKCVKTYVCNYLTAKLQRQNNTSTLVQFFSPTENTAWKHQAFLLWLFYVNRETFA